ncbi:MAG: DUF262 domain-containing protein [Microthrixaceae bacterium]
MQLSAQKTTLAGLFGRMGQQFVVPHYQRPYAWLDDNVDDLWGDLLEGLESGHFMGSLVIAGEDDDSPQVIDGQQRLTTITILLAQIRDRFTALDLHENAANVQTLLHSDALADDDSRWKLRIGDTNWKVFRNLILRPSSDPQRLQFDALASLSRDEQARNERLIQNALRLRQRIDELVDGASTDDEVALLTRLLRTVVQKLEFVAIHVGSLADAFLLFETLNDRGLDLSAADLLKNHLMARTEPALVPEVGREWEGMLVDLGAAVDVTLFFRHYLLLHHRDVRKEQVYDLFKTQVEKEGPSSVLQELRLYAKYYGQFANPSLLTKEEAAAASVLTDLNTLRATSCFVTLLPGRRYLSTDDFAELARVCEVYVFRANSVLGANSQQVQDQFKRAARLLAESKGAKLAEVYASFRQAMPDKEIFAAAFRRQRLGTHYLAKYMLRKIEEELAPTSEVMVQQGAKVHLEHILPQTLSTAWRAQLPDGGDGHADMVGRWGNLTLLDPGLNIKAGNRPFKEKQTEAYQYSVLALNTDLKAASGWGYPDIEARQGWLADLANQVWDMDRVVPPDTVDRKAETESEALPPPLADLEPELMKVFQPLCQETPYEDLVEFRSTIDVYLGTVEIEAAQNDDVDFPMAVKLHRVLASLIDLAAAMNAEERALLRGAIEFFALIGDAAHDFAAEGFGDDRCVVNAVCAVIGFPEMQVA